MAETDTIKTRRHITSMRIVDGGSTDYTVPLRGDLSYTPGGYNLVDVKDYDGSFTAVSPTRGEEQPTTGSVTATQRGIGDRALEADIGLVDFINDAGIVLASTTTGTEAGTVSGEHQRMFTIIFLETDHTATETLTFPRCTFSGSSFSSSLDGNQISLSFTSRAAYPTSSFA